MTITSVRDRIEQDRHARSFDGLPTNKHAVEFVRLGYGDSHNLPFRNLSFTAPIDSRATFNAAVRTIGGYNHFQADRVLDALDPVLGSLNSIEVGRASSPLIVAKVPFWTHQRNDSTSYGMGEKHTPEQRVEIAAEVIDRARRIGLADSTRCEQYGAPENDREWVQGTGTHPYTIRLWWD